MLDQLYSIRITKPLAAGIFLSAAVMGGCMSSQSIRTEEKQKYEQPAEKKIRLSESEATFNPIEYDREIEIVPKVQREEKKQQNPVEIPKDSMVVQEEVIQGFRIQIFSSSNVDEATAAKNLATEKFAGDSIYVVYDSPVYKVRLGDFVHRYEANQRLPEFIEKGFRDAWIVPDWVVQRKLVQFPIAK
jgi:hypothetical protein